MESYSDIKIISKEEDAMERTYKLIELIGISQQSYEDAIQNAVAKAAQTVKGLSWFEVVTLSGHIQGDKITEYQAKIKLAFRVLDHQ